MSEYEDLSPEESQGMARAMAIELIHFSQETDLFLDSLFDEPNWFKFVQYDDFSPLLWRASASGTIFPNFPEDVTDELRAEAARILGEDMPPLDELLENRFTIMKAAVRKCWDLMSKTARTTDMELSLYEGFHGALEEMELVPQSPAVLELLGVDAETFRSVDQAHALNFVYHQGTVLTDIGAEVAMLYAAIAENDRAETAVSQALVQEFINARDHLGGNCQSLINYAARVSQLDNAQIQSYISGRLDREASRIGAGDAGQPRRTLN